MADAREGSRASPELARVQRLLRERAAVPGDGPAEGSEEGSGDQDAAEELDPVAVMGPGRCDGTDPSCRR